MRIAFTPVGWEDFAYWIETDLIEEASRRPFEGLGEPEPLRHDLAGWWSRRIDQEHRLVYRATMQNSDQVLEIAQCRHHY